MPSLSVGVRGCCYAARECASAESVVAAEQCTVFAHEAVSGTGAYERGDEQEYAAGPDKFGIGHVGVHYESAGDNRCADEHYRDKSHCHLAAKVAEEEDGDDEQCRDDEIDDKEYGCVAYIYFGGSLSGSVDCIWCGAENAHQYYGDEEKEVLPALNNHFCVDFMCVV